MVTSDLYEATFMVYSGHKWTRVWLDGDKVRFEFEERLDKREFKDATVHLQGFIRCLYMIKQVMTKVKEGRKPLGPI